MATSECAQSRGHCVLTWWGCCPPRRGPTCEEPSYSQHWLGPERLHAVLSHALQPQPGMRFFNNGQLEETRTLEIHVKQLTRTEAAFGKTGGTHGAGEAGSCPGSQPRHGGSAEALVGLGGKWGVLCPPCPGLCCLTQPLSGQVTNTAWPWGSAHSLRSPQLPLREFIYTYPIAQKS